MAARRRFLAWRVADLAGFCVAASCFFLGLVVDLAGFAG